MVRPQNVFIGNLLTNDDNISEADLFHPLGPWIPCVFERAITPITTAAGIQQPSLMQLCSWQRLIHRLP